MSRRPRPLVLFVVATLSAVAALALVRDAAASGNGGIEESAYFEPMPVVLTASRLPQPLQDAPGAMSVIDRELIEASGYRDIPRLLRFVPGMHIGHERGSATWVSYHGLGLSSPGEMQVLVDGATVHVPINFGTIGWSGVPLFLSDVERIEVVRGASANSLGASALLGTVNLITRAGGEEPGTHVSVLLGDPGIRDIEVGWSGDLAPTALRVTAGEQHDEGFTGLHDTRTTQRMSLRADTRVDAENTFTLRLGASLERPQRGYPDSPLGNNALRTAEDQSHMLHLRWQRVTDTDREWSASLYHHRLDFEDNWASFVPGVTLAPVTLSRDRQDERTGIEIQVRDRWTPSLRGVWGLSSNQLRTRSRFSFSSHDTLVVDQHRAFGNLEWQPADALSLNAGLAVEDQDNGWHLSPRLYASYQTGPGTTWRMGASRTWRTPTVFERYGNIRVYDSTVPGLLLANPYSPNPDLRDTRADTFEVGMIRQFETAHSMLDLRLFRENLKDLTIRRQTSDTVPVLASVAPTTRFENYSDPVRLTGLEVQFTARPWRGAQWRLAYSLIDRHANDEAITAGIAPYTANLSWQQAWPDQWESFVSLTRVGPVASGDSFVANGRYMVDDFTTVDISISRRLQLLGQPARLSLTALNLGPRHQEIAEPAMQSVYGNRAANRTSRQVFAGLSMRF
jgi:iron complex outermembrane receptor protein